MLVGALGLHWPALTQGTSKMEVISTPLAWPTPELSSPGLPPLFQSYKYLRDQLAWPGALRAPEKPRAKNAPEMGKTVFMGKAGIGGLGNSWWLGALGGGGGLLLQSTELLHLQQQ